MNRPSSNSIQKTNSRIQPASYLASSQGMMDTAKNMVHFLGKKPEDQLTGRMVALNKAAQLPKSEYNQTSCDLRIASSSLRKSILQRKSSRLCYGLVGYSFGLQCSNSSEISFLIFINNNMSMSEQSGRRIVGCDYRDLYDSMSRPGSTVKRQTFSDQLCLQNPCNPNDWGRIKLTVTRNQWPLVPRKRRDRNDQKYTSVIRLESILLISNP